MSDGELEAALRRIAGAPVLLVASDYDGTLAPIVADPARASPEADAVEALRELAGLADTHVAVVSGRSVDDLASLSGLSSAVHLVGSHGSESRTGFVAPLDPANFARRDELIEALHRLARRGPGLTVEEKPASVTLHYRNADPELADDVVAEVLEGPAALPGVSVKHGKMVVELMVVETDKGQALDRLRDEVGADAMLFLGDDVTDEDAFARLRPGDLGVKVGPGETAATHRVSDTRAVAGALARLVGLRRDASGGA